MNLTSVWNSDDGAFCEAAIPFYLRRERRTPVLDATWGNGVFWKSSPLRPEVVGIDLCLDKRPTLYADNQVMPFGDDTFDVIVYDPPHVTHDWSPWDSAGQYAVAAGRGSIAYLYPAFLAEAQRVLTPDGIVIAKIADQIHSGRTFLQTFEFTALLPEHGFVACDLIVKVRASARPQPSGRRTLRS